MKRQKMSGRGFSLVEVNLAIFVVATGVLTIFSLFPAGLRQVASSSANTQEAMFADYVFATLRSEAGAVPAADWGASALDGVIEAALSATGGNPLRADFAGGEMLYSLTFKEKGSLIAASLSCQAGDSVNAGYSIERYEPKD